MTTNEEIIDLTVDEPFREAGPSGVIQNCSVGIQCKRCVKSLRGKRRSCRVCTSECVTLDLTNSGSSDTYNYNINQGKKRKKQAVKVPRVEVVSVKGAQYDQWTCQFCTIMNYSYANKCSMCGRAREEAVPPTPQRSGDCAICFEEIRLADEFEVSRCHHTMCKECAKTLVTTEISCNNIPIPCPVCKAAPCSFCAQAASQSESDAALRINQCCQLSQQDVKQILQESEYQRYLSLEAKQSVKNLEFFTCPGQDCGQAYEVEQQQCYFKCPECSFEFCLSCGVGWHHGSNCEKYQKWRKENEVADEKFKNMKKSSCPKCKHAVVKEDQSQCNKIFCGNCRIFFCFLCEQKIRGYCHFSDKKSECYGKLWDGVVPSHLNR